MNKQSLVLLLFAAVAFFFWSKSEIWSAVLYPNKNDLTVDLRLGEFDNVEDCRAAILEKLDEQNIARENADWECGLNCKPFATDMLMCDETLK